MEISEDHSDLIDIKIDPIKAIDEKWRRGRIKYGREWVGSRPIIEAHAEALDLGAYLLEEHRKGGVGINTDLLDELIRSVINAIHGIRNAISMMHEEE
jgi:hypothetical protein